MERYEILQQFIQQHYYNEIMELTKEDRPFLLIDFGLLDRFDPIIADALLATPEAVLDDFSKAIELFDIKQKVPVRVRNLPERCVIRLRNLRAEHIGRLISTDVIVKSASEVKPQISEIIFQCPECGNIINIEQKDVYLIKKPVSCSSCGRRGEFPIKEKKMIDIRVIRGMEPFELTTGEQPSELSIFLSNDLTTPKMQKKTDPGNRVRVVGILKELPKRIKGKMTIHLDTIIEANWVEPSETEYEELDITPEDEAKIIALSKEPDIHKKLARSIAPGIWGFDEIKEAIVLQLFGGITHINPDGTRTRGNIHILLTGDPGVGKTMLLKQAAHIVPRGKYVSGSGVTGAGLTATVRKDEVLGSWVLEAGALILCNKGLISIDEFDKMSRDDQIAMHEATSVETVSIAKASIVATLPAQTAVLAGANPKLGRFDRYSSIAQQIEIPETLLSRFDLKFALRDVPSRERDSQLADHIISSRMVPESVTPEINVNLLRKYIAYARKNITNIELSPEAAEVMKNFYIDMRSGSGEDMVAITLRQYEALIRLAESSAKIRLDNTIRIEDAERSIRLMKFSLMQLAYDFESGKYDIDRIDSGVSATQRSRIRTILEIVETLQKEAGGEVSIEDVKAEAEQRGIKTEDVESIMDRMKTEGLLFEPKAGYIKKA